MKKAKHSEQETGTDLLTNGMSLRGTKDNNLFHFHAPIPKKKMHRNAERDDRVSAPRHRLLVGCKSHNSPATVHRPGTVFKLKPASIRALSEQQHNGYN